MLIGHVEEIVRHPVKSFRGEKVEATNVMSYGLYGDRSHAFSDRTRPGKFLTITQFPEMVLYSAKFNGEESMDRFPPVEVKTPSNEVLNWGDSRLTEEIASKGEREIEPITFDPAAVPLGAIEEEHILIVTDASMEKLKSLSANANLDYQRFRPNLYLALNDKDPFIEESWFGKKLKIGDAVVLRLIRHCERCMIVTVDPMTAHTDPSLLQTLVRKRNNHFGVYAGVLKTGKIRTGDPVYLID
ncbi:MOSC domain-containing protein [Bacillus massilinigeriensis]|uniref:MOSC domain-containing protein n=1 Tax=Bacillus mediterraneensis TaxID=1805474 RepID=UPI0008F8C659|nr:MOSC N-terminal beta barrel domain-containing protein [Bacillus mediterraneensis]